jgi:Zn-dependent protease
MLLSLLRLPIELALFLGYFLLAVADTIAGRKRRRFESTVLFRAPREAVWRFFSAKRMVLEGPPTTIELAVEPVPGEDGLMLTRVTVAGRELGRAVSRTLRHDAEAGISLSEIVPHELTMPPLEGTDYIAGVAIKEVPGGTAVTRHYEVTFGSFAQRVKVPFGMHAMGARLKRQCEKDAGTQSRLAQLANHWLVLSMLAIASFSFLLGWQDALLITLVVVLHELGHAAAMRMVGIPVQGIYLIPFFGGVAVPKAAYRSQGQLGFVALMGAGFSLLPTLALVGLYYATGDALALHAALMFALINGLNLLPIYPLDGGLILNTLLGSLNMRLARWASWGGVLVGLGIGAYLHSALIGLPFVLFAVGLFLAGGRSLGLKRLSALGGGALMLAFAGTLGAHLATFLYANHVELAIADAAERRVAQPAPRLVVPLRCDLPDTSADLLDRYLGEHGTDGRTLLRTLAWADRAGHREIIRDRFSAPRGTRPPADLVFLQDMGVEEWLDLAKTGSLDAIDREIARSPYPSLLRDVLTTALVAHGRYRDALDLSARIKVDWEAQLWRQRALAELAKAGATIEAASLLESIGADSAETGTSDPALMLAVMLRRVPAALADKRRLVAAIVDQLASVRRTDRESGIPECLRDTPHACSEKDQRAVDRYNARLTIRLGEIEALARFGETGFDLAREEEQTYFKPSWQVRAVVAGALAERGDLEGAEALRRFVASLPAVWPYPSTPVSKVFDIVYAATRVSLSLNRGEVDKAEALAEAAAGPAGVPLSIRTLMIDHYVWAGDWQRAEAWSKREILPGPATNEGAPEAICQFLEDDGAYELCLGDREPAAARDLDSLWLEAAGGRPKAPARLEMDYRLQLAAAAAAKGDAALAATALEEARSISCQRAIASPNLRPEWSTFLRKAYLVKAVQEGRLPAHALELPW